MSKPAVPLKTTEPEANVERYVFEETERLVVDALRIVAVPVVFELVTESPEAERLVVEALVPVRVPMNAEVRVAPVAES